MRVVLGVQYQGTHYHGWQSQPGRHTVQSHLEQAIRYVNNAAAAVTCAGRTDVGVHALGQVIHFDTESERTAYSWVAGVNTRLPADIAVDWACIREAPFHARFSALARHYRYIIANTNARPGVWGRHVTWHPAPLDEQAMHQAAQYLLGTHDFSAFRGKDCQAHSPVRTVRSLTVSREGVYIIIDVTANAFLHHMVRNIVGVLLDIGEGKHAPHWTQIVLEKGIRKEAGVMAKASGLTLISVEYPEEFQIPKTLTHTQPLLL